MTTMFRWKMIVAVWLIVVLLALILIVIIGKSLALAGGSVNVVDPVSGEQVFVSRNRMLTHDRLTNIATLKSDEGKLVAFGAGLLELEDGFNGPIAFFRNDNAEGENFYLDFIAYSWHPHEALNPLVVVSIVYDSSEPGEYTFEPNPISMNQNYPNAARDNGIFVRAWSGGNKIGMIGSTGGRGIMVFTLQSEFRQIFFDGKIIIGPGGTQRFDVRTDAAGALRFGAVGWFAKSI
jgi:hypothetical protein